MVGHESGGKSDSTVAANGLRHRSICFGLVFIIGLGKMIASEETGLRGKVGPVCRLVSIYPLHFNLFV